MLDGDHTGANRRLDALGAVRVGRDPRPCRAASSTTAVISSSLNCWAPTGPSSDRTPAVAQILITWAPCLIW